MINCFFSDKIISGRDVFCFEQESEQNHNYTSYKMIQLGNICVFAPNKVGIQHEMVDFTNQPTTFGYPKCDPGTWHSPATISNLSGKMIINHQISCIYIYIYHSDSGYFVRFFNFLLRLSFHARNGLQYIATELLRLLLFPAAFRPLRGTRRCSCDDIPTGYPWCNTPILVSKTAAILELDMGVYYPPCVFLSPETIVPIFCIIL